MSEVGTRKSEVGIPCHPWCALSSIGILFNATLVAATLKSKSLRSMCNLLIASDSTFLALYQLNALITFFLPIFGANFVPIWLCFCLQLVPYFSVLMSLSLVFQIGLERLANVLFPIWSKNGNSKRFHAILLLLSVMSNCYLMWLQYEMADGNNSMVFCTASSARQRFVNSTIRQLSQKATIRQLSQMSTIRQLNYSSIRRFVNLAKK
ncbi:hypothetical protein niasHT_012553 [Heterodera trifolii]|uniref:G-protein coupled receptors family 1 profile domain-containing protein n=1 Tax=Heterodera trifolii TaxID=157864 RepID=A0ABD2L1E0_9BILA